MEKHSGKGNQFCELRIHIPYLDADYIWDVKIIWHLIFFYMKLRCESVEYLYSFILLN